MLKELTRLAALGLAGVSASLGDVSGESKGEALAKAHCATCHQFTPPELLTKRSWNFLLTYMGMRLGIDDDSYLTDVDSNERSVNEARRLALSLAKQIPDTPAMGDEDWRLLRKYYADHAPETALLPEGKPASAGVADLFREKIHGYRIEQAVTSLVFIDSKNQQLLIGDSRNQILTILSPDLTLVSHGVPADHTYWVDAIPTEKGLYLLSIGDIAGYYVGGKLGKVVYDERIGGAYLPDGVVLKNLYRPTDMEFADMDGDGIEELLVCGFGDEGGDFSIYRRQGDGKAFEQEPIVRLYSDTGPMQCAAYDFDGNGLNDVLLMVSDFDEQLSLFLNKGNGVYEKRPIVSAHPSWGFTSFQLVDMNGDGRIDIVVTNGDGVDSDPYNTLKRYQGVRIYLNDGQLGFSESYFYPMYGCYKARAFDYDQDGDIDIAACAFYPDFEAEAPETFVYLECAGPMEFAPKHHPAAQAGRWMTMDAGDLDQDGDIDLVLGATYIPMGLPFSQLGKLDEIMKNSPSLLFLENRLGD